MPLSPALSRTELRRKVLAGVGLIFLFLAVIAFVSFRSTDRHLLAARAMEQTRQVLEVEERARRSLAELENLRLRFLVIPSESLIAEYEAARDAVQVNFGDLAKSVVEDEPQSERLASLHEPLQNFFALQQVEMNARIEAGPTPVKELIDRGLIAKFTQRIDRTFTEFETTQNQRVRERTEEADRFAGQNRTVIIISTALTFIALWQAAAMILRDFAKRRRAEEAMADEHNLFSAIIDTIPAHVFVKDVKGRYVFENAAHRRSLGIADESAIERTAAAEHAADEAGEPFSEEDRRIVETGQAMLNREVPVTRAGAVEEWLETTKIPLREADGTIVGLIGVSSDISARKRQEVELQHSAEQLKRSNEELQNFANVASHDLQEPLRKIQAFGDRLRVKCAPQLGDAGLDYLERMESAARRMQSLIQDLLKLSRVVTQAQPFERCDLQKILRDALSDLEVALEKSEARISIGPLPAVDGDPVQLWQLFQNLVNNSVKFRRPGVPPEIRITGRVFAAPADLIAGAAAGDPVAEITVQDNGIGFEEKFAEQIFVVFQRLHSRDEYPGTGIGLAVCRKITDRHAGRIVAKSRPGGGAIFLVTLPVQQPSLKNHE